jgi:hypothetical protein
MMNEYNNEQQIHYACEAQNAKLLPKGPIDSSEAVRKMQNSVKDYFE